ncbi:MAG: hypothetical protein IJK89_01700 [Clostridia bacterium]|nr:hypothetical protein [Clostridia bacterium]
MEYGFSILMFCLAGGMLLYALLLYNEKKRPDLLIPRRVYTSRKNWAVPYARKLAKIVALCAVSPLLTGVVGLFAKPLIAGIVFVLTLILFIWLGIRVTGIKGDYED